LVYIVLNGKKSGDESVRDSIATLRQQMENVEVRVTYEYGDVERFLDEAIGNGVERFVIGGGDGSVNEAVNAIARLPKEKRPVLAILPLGTANDFATACNIPRESLDALHLAVDGDSSPIDIIAANDRFFVNMATAGFGAQVTAETPVALKNFLGRGAYTLTGVIKALNFVSYHAHIKTPEFESDMTGYVAAIGNGRQAGGGQVLTPKAFIDDGLLDVMIIKEVLNADIATLLDEIRDPSEKGQYINYFQTTWFHGTSEMIIPVNLDGEPYQDRDIHFEVIPGAVDLVLPQDCPCLVQNAD